MSLFYKTLKPLIPGIACIAILLHPLPSFAGPPISIPNSNFFDVNPEPTRPSSHTPAELNKIFSIGQGPYSSSMAGKIYPYPYPRNGALGSPLMNGCYDDKNRRLGDLDSDLDCDTIAASLPNTPIYRMFIGYKIDCGMTPATSGPLAGICTNAALTLNCVFDQQQRGAPPNNFASARLECSAGTGIIRRVRASSEEVPGYLGCYPGQDGTAYPNCTACASGRFNSIVDENKSACIQCSTTNHPIPNHDPLNPPTTWVTNTSDPIFGAMSADQCRVAAGDPWTCLPGFDKDLTNQYCIPTPPPANCVQLVTTSVMNPSAPGASDGLIQMSATGGSGTFNFLLSPVTGASNFSGGFQTFSGLNATAAPGKTYTVSVTDVSDATCSVNMAYVLTDPTPGPSPTPTPTPSPSPTPSSTPPPSCTLAFTTTKTDPSGPSMADGRIIANHTGALGAVTYSISPSLGSTSTTPSSVTFDGLTAATTGTNYTVTLTDNNCSRTGTVTLTPAIRCSDLTCPSGYSLYLFPYVPDVQTYTMSATTVQATNGPSCRDTGGHALIGVCGTSAPSAPNHACSCHQTYYTQSTSPLCPY